MLLTIHWSGMLLGLAAILAWPIAAYIAGAKVVGWGVARSIRFAISVGFVTLFAGFLLSNIMWSNWAKEETPVLEVAFPVVWIGFPFLLLFVSNLIVRFKKR